MSIFENANVDAGNPGEPARKKSHAKTQRRKDYEVERPKVEPERLLSFFRDWFTTEMDWFTNQS
jgi:hypothetical protein